MASVGRNDPCPCGSGLKYKKCHGGPLPPAGPRPKRLEPDLLMTGALSPKTESFNAKLLGFPGQQQYIVIVNEFKPEAQRLSSPVGHSGDYRVVFVLSKPGHTPHGDRSISFDLGAQGDSHISLNAEHAKVPGTSGEIKLMHVDTNSKGDEIHFECHPNPRGFIARIEATVKATDFVDADLIASRALTPILSSWSTTLNCTGARTANRDNGNSYWKSTNHGDDAVHRSTSSAGRTGER